jgi:hypothetical protein
VPNVHGFHDVRQMDIHMAEPLVPEPNMVKVEVTIGKLKKYKPLCTDQIRAKFIKAGGETLHTEIHRLIYSIWNKEELSQQWKESIIVPIYKKGDKTVYKILSNILLARLAHMSMKLLGIISVSSIVTDLLLIKFSTFARY